MEGMDSKQERRCVVEPERQAAEEASKAAGKGHEGAFCGAAIELPDGRIVTGRNSPLMHAASSATLNAAKKLAGIPHEIALLSENVINSVATMKRDLLGSRTASLSLGEALIALAISGTQNPTAKVVIEKLGELRDCEMHVTHMPTPGDEAGLRQLGINLTSEPNFASRELFTT